MLRKPSIKASPELHIKKASLTLNAGLSLISEKLDFVFWTIRFTEIVRCWIYYSHKHGTCNRALKLCRNTSVTKVGKSKSRADIRSSLSGQRSVEEREPGTGYREEEETRDTENMNMSSTLASVVLVFAFQGVKSYPNVSTLFIKGFQ